MKGAKFIISNDATRKLQFLKGKTGLTPNILLRVGFCLSLRDGSLLSPEKYPQDGMELNRYTITGEYDAAFVSLLKEWIAENYEKNYELSLVDYFRAHLNRGAILLSGRIKSLSDLVYLE